MAAARIIGAPAPGGLRLSIRPAIALVLALAAFPVQAAAPARDPAKAPAGSYVLDPRRGGLAVRASYLGGLASGRVRFTGLSGSFAYDPATWQATRVTIAVDPRSAAAPESAFVRRVVSALDPDRHPTIRFTSTSLASDADGRGRLTGDLTLHGVTRPVTLDIVFRGLDTEQRLGFSGRGRIKRSEFGVTAARPFVGDVLDLTFEVEFVRK